MLLHVDGWLCEIKDVQIRDGLHVLGAAPRRRGRARPGAGDPAGPPAVGRRVSAVPGLRTGARPGRGRRDAWPRSTPSRPQARALVAALRGGQLGRECRRRGRRTELGHADPRSPRCCGSPPTEVVPRLAQTTDEIDAVLHALDGGFIPAGPSGSPLRGLVNVLPTGRNFYSVDPKAVPSRLAWETGVAMADSLLERYLADTGELPAVGGAVGVGHLGDAHRRRRHRRSACAARRPAGVGRRVAARRRPRRSIPLAELGRPRIDVTVRISGFFRDAFPHVVDHARRRGPPGRGARRARRAELRPRPRQARPGRARRRTAGHHAASSVPSRAPTVPGCCS